MANRIRIKNVNTFKPQQQSRRSSSHVAAAVTCLKAACLHSKLARDNKIIATINCFCLGRAVGYVVKVSVRGSEGRRFDTRLHQLSD